MNPTGQLPDLLDDARLEEVRDAERRRMACDLHDDALADLADALERALQTRARVTEGEAADRLDELVAALERVRPELRAAIYDLRLSGGEERPVAELLADLADVQDPTATGGAVELDVRHGLPAEPLGRAGTEVLRIAGEALANARRRAAGRIRLLAWGAPAALFVEISDDGRGAGDAQAVARRAAGLDLMHERAQLLGAALRVTQGEQGGTVVTIELPLARRREAGGEEVRVLLVEDHAAVRQAIAASLEREPDFRVTGQAATLAEARQMLDDVDVAVLDLGLPDGYGGELIADLRERSPRAHTLVLSASLDRAELARAVEHGAAGALDKTAHLGAIVAAVRRLRAGDALLRPDEVVDLIRHAGVRSAEDRDARRAADSLTRRERQVLQALAEGHDTRRIAEDLDISLSTQRNHVASILAKLGVHSQLQAVLFALRHGVVPEPRRRR